MVGHHPTNKLIGREPIPTETISFPHPPCSRRRISRISHTFMRLSRRRGQVTHVLLTRSPLIQNQQAGPFTVRLACVKHAASVRPEPGSNSPNKTNKTRPQPTTNSQPEPNVSTTVQKTRPGPTQPPQQREPGKPKQNKPQKPHKHAQPPGPWHKKHDTLSSSQTTHPPRFETRKNSLLASRRRPD